MANREVAANYVGYLIETKDGESLLGLIVSDTATSITIRQAYGKDTTIPRSQIKRMSSQGKSMMPPSETSFSAGCTSPNIWGRYTGRQTRSFGSMSRPYPTRT